MLTAKVFPGRPDDDSHAIFSIRRAARTPDASVPHAKHALPPLPPKSALFKFRPKFLETRRIGLQYFLNCVLLNPEFSGSPVLKDFLFSHIN
jgi:hypothetical protein